MKSIISIKNKTYVSDLSAGTNISIPFISESLGPNCFYAPGFKATPLVSGDFVGSVKSGSPVNFYNVEINPHGNGTHTECVGHICDQPIYIKDVAPKGLQLAQLVSLKPQAKGEDLIISSSDWSNLQIQDNVNTLVIRTIPNSNEKESANYSGSNPAYVAPGFIKQMIQEGIEHLIIDLPSIDKEKDGGALKAHKAFWQFPETINKERTISEMVYIPDILEDGLYLCSINPLPFQLDAAPSSITLFKMEEKSNE